MTTIAPAVVLKLNKYANLKIEIKQLEAELEEMKEELVYAIPEGAEVQVEEGSFTVSQRTTYTYSPETQAREKALKQDKKSEEADGTAIPKKGDPFITFRAKETE